MRKKLIIGFVGYKDSGKSTTSRLLEKEIRETSSLPQRISFSQPLYDALEIFGVPDVYVHDNTLRDKPIPHLGGKTARQLMATLGTEWGRNMVDPNIWINIAMKRMVNEHVSFYIIDGVRFPNEAAAIAKQNGVLIHVVNDDITPDVNHESEQHIEKLSKYCDFTVDNTNRQAASHVMDLADFVFARYEDL